MENLSNRVLQIISENGLKQKEFAKSINVTESYISKLLKGESGLSKSTAALIEERYGYSAKWILDGISSQNNRKINDKGTTTLQRKIISDIEQMDETDLVAVKAFITSLQEYKKRDLNENN